MCVCQTLQCFQLWIINPLLTLFLSEYFSLSLPDWDFCVCKSDATVVGVTSSIYSGKRCCLAVERIVTTHRAECV